ncbi:30S ribosomal protein S12 methylthiotransferase RimO [Helicobacter sp. 23-1046]
MQKTLHLISLGCTKNLIDSEVMLGKLSSYKLVEQAHNADVIIINTCGFIQSAKQESLEKIFNAHSVRKKDSLLVVSGCLSERYYDELKSEIPEIDIITGVGDYDKIDEMIESKRSLHSQKVFLADETHSRVVANSTFHAYIKLSEGCNQQCSFCAIPHFKGKLHSRTLDSVIKELEILYNQGFRDFSLIAQDSSSFLRDLGVKNGLSALIKRIDSLNLPITVRILYLYPSTTDENLIESIANSSSFLPYFDMPLQHISNAMLKVMNRGANKAHHLKLLKLMDSVRGRFLRTGFIIGHPQESDRDFSELCEFVRDFRFDRINAFEFSPQEDTRSFTMPKLDSKLIQSRLKVFENIIKKKHKATLKNLLHQKLEIIIEGQSELSEHFYNARARLWAKDIDGTILINEVANGVDIRDSAYECEITQVKDEFIFGKVLKAL